MAEEPGQENRDAPSNGDKPSRGRLIGFAAVGAIVVVVLLLVWVHPTDSTEKKDFIQAVGVLLAALAGLGGLYFTSQNLKQTRQDTENQLQQARDSTNAQLRQARDSQKQTQRLTEQGQITERFTRAIDQLGNEKTEVRIGGIYALESIAKESEDYYWPIVEILTSFVQTRVPRAKETLVDKALSENRGEEDDKNRRHQHPFLDVQAVLYVLARREHILDPKDDDRFINLSNTDLRDADLRGANLKGARLRQVNLKGAILRRVAFDEAVLIEAHLEETRLERATFTKANLREANLSGAREWTEEQLTAAKSLKGAIMPDGSKHP